MVHGSRSVPRPLYLALAKSIDTVDLIEFNESNGQALKRLLTSVIRCECAPNTLAEGTYRLIRDAMAKWDRMPRSGRLAQVPSNRLIVTVLTTDVSLFSGDMTCISSEVQMIYNMVSQMKTKNVKVSIHVLAALVIAVSQTNTTYREKVFCKALSTFQIIQEYLKFSIMGNSEIYFSMALADWFASVVKEKALSIILPSTSMTKMTLEVHLKGINLFSHEWMSVFGENQILKAIYTVPRSGIDPLHIKGVNLIVLPATDLKEPQ